MDHARYLPASRVKAGGFRLGRLSVRRRSGQEIGKLLGFVVEMSSHQIWGLVVESGESKLVIPMAPMQFDPQSRSLRLVQPEAGVAEYATDSIPTVADEDLWIPFFHTPAA
jgi:hypothetical protein